MLMFLRLAGTFVLASLMIVAAIMLADKALTPLPQPRETHPADRRLAAENQNLRAELLALTAEHNRLLAENATLKINVECLMKVAVFAPRRGAPEAGAAAPDLLPPLRVPVPTRPEE